MFQNFLKTAIVAKSLLNFLGETFTYEVSAFIWDLNLVDDLIWEE